MMMAAKNSYLLMTNEMDLRWESMFGGWMRLDEEGGENAKEEHEWWRVGKERKKGWRGGGWSEKVGKEKERWMDGGGRRKKRRGRKPVIAWKERRKTMVMGQRQMRIDEEDKGWWCKEGEKVSGNMEGGRKMVVETLAMAVLEWRWQRQEEEGEGWGNGRPEMIVREKE